MRRPSPLWNILAALGLLLAIALVTVSVVQWRAANTPIGEGQLFVRDAARALGMINPGLEPELKVRQIRNELRIEAVSYIDSDGTVVASTSPTLTGYGIENGVLSFGRRAGRFVAVASPIDHDILIDDVVEWQAGDVLYRVLQPTPDGALLLDYDIKELLARRSGQAGITSETVRLFLAGLAFAFVAIGALVGRNRTAQRFRELDREADMMRRHTAELEATNVELEVARARAEEALALAEEKNRIRAEFVLMINHELRTPLTAVVTGADLLRNDPGLDQATRSQLLDAMVLDGRRLEEMIDQMLAVARIENRGLNLNLAPVAGEDVCLDVISRHPDLGHSDHAHELPSAVADRTALTRLLLSLVDNARTHGASDVSLECTTGVPFEPDVEVGSRPEDSLTFVIKDDGPGIDPEFLPRIFEKYEKHSFSSGTGLGLYMARMMAEALGGSIAVKTSPRGTQMAVSVRVHRQPAIEKAAS